MYIHTYIVCVCVNIVTQSCRALTANCTHAYKSTRSRAHTHKQMPRAHQQQIAPDFIRTRIKHTRTHSGDLNCVLNTHTHKHTHTHTHHSGTYHTYIFTYAVTRTYNSVIAILRVGDMFKSGEARELGVCLCLCGCVYIYREGRREI